MESLGQYLKKERESRGISLKEISQKTKIRERILIALEEDDFGPLPEPPYLKGFLRSYSDCLGLNKDDVLLIYEENLRLNRRDNEASSLLFKKFKINNFKRKYTLWSIIFLITIVYVFGIYLLSIERVNPDKIKEEKNKLPYSEIQKFNFKEDINLKEIEAVSRNVGNDPIKVRASASEKTWIRVNFNGKDEKEVLLNKGESVSWEAEESMELLIGNAGGVEITTNKKKLGKLGPSGEVVTLKLPEEQVYKIGDL